MFLPPSTPAIRGYWPNSALTFPCPRSTCKAMGLLFWGTGSWIPKALPRDQLQKRRAHAWGAFWRDWAHLLKCLF